MDKKINQKNEKHLKSCKTCGGSGKVPKPPELGDGFSSGITTFPDQYIPCYACQSTEQILKGE